jgi:hypothetical protein
LSILKNLPAPFYESDKSPGNKPVGRAWCPPW